MPAVLAVAWSEVRLPVFIVGGTAVAAAVTEFVAGVEFFDHPTIWGVGRVGAVIGGLYVYLLASAALFRRLTPPPRLLPLVAWATAQRARAVEGGISFGVAWLALIVSAEWKRALGLHAGFTADTVLADLDHVVHGGDAWTLLVLPPVLTVAVDWAYAAWLATLLPLVAWFCWQRDRTRRRHFLLAFTLAWIGLGVMVSWSFPSGGPCYYARITGTDRFAALFAHLSDIDRATPLLSIALQNWLWTAHITQDYPTRYSGISAMPSMHVAWPVLVVLASRGVFRWAAGAYAAITLIGSIALGWHYAVDGYASLIAVVGIWLLADRLTRLSIRPRPLNGLGPPQDSPALGVT